ncbi:MAG TPA: hypothetical protein VFR18_09790 [Terriglobia bacterium]|nr:hypothetical protein [Terriglobia bacterium]
MKRAGLALTLFVFAFLSVSGAHAQAKSSLVGVWKITEVVGPNPIEKPQPSIYIFTAKHYSIMSVSGAASRKTDVNDRSSDSEKLAAWTPFTAHSGTYDSSGNEITLRQIVAKNPSVMLPGNFVTFEVTMASDRVMRLRQKANQQGPITAPFTAIFERLE